MLFFPVAGGIAATVTLFPIAGVHSLWFLTAVLPGIVFYRTFGTVGRRVESLLRELEETGGEAVEGFLVIGKTPLSRRRRSQKNRTRTGATRRCPACVSTA